MTNLEYVADALMKFEGWMPGSLSYKHRNPGNLEGGGSRAISHDGVYNVYNSLIDGYLDLLDDLHGKFTGNNKHGLGPSSTLFELMSIYSPPPENPTEKYTIFLADWLTKALSQVHALTTPITPRTMLSEIYAVPDNK